MRALSAKQALTCETAKLPGCRWRRCTGSGTLHGAQRLGGTDPTGDQGPERAVPLPGVEGLFALPEDDPHRIPTPEQRKEARRATRRLKARAVAALRWGTAALLLVVAAVAAPVAGAHDTPLGAQIRLHAQAHADEQGVPELGWLMFEIVDCETGHTLNPRVVGQLGELGPAQLYPRGGEWPRFQAYAAERYGYADPFDWDHALSYLAIALREGRACAWTCAWRYVQCP